ncbi:(2Fe-2S) ferredoxin domain-containing protein [Scytonema sp. UIC 10036]|uniref:(2Fe-2S) ferredoxin domain-containing protein n=1 Tax=Scytonema sp. UIC 10036 TaxID=2304196 RepID=UPI0012DAC52F|nr:(2Fe-2S) ferredoxin domain-containing protein [Scytonema sp. UIC 10036]MUH01378.1 (2Fe-2S) ferredoxin domain-containing protein [Scytonema sp. UIC 10036]
MGKCHMTEVSEFRLEGRFLDFVIKDGYKLKGLLLETSEGECYVKLAKHLRVAFDWRLQKGTWLQVLGEKKHDLKTGEVKLKAYQVMAAQVETREQGGKGTREETISLSSSFSKSPRADVPMSSSHEVRTKKATILVCQKSDCMKRGGKQLCQAIEASVSARGLESEVTIKGTGCMKNCKAGPNLVMPDKTRYSRIQAAQVPALMDKHFSPQSADSDNEAILPVAKLTDTDGYLPTS